MSWEMSKLKELRERAGLTQEQMAQRMGVTQSAWQRWETGEREGWRKRVDDIARITGTSVTEVMAPSATRIPIVAYVGLGAEIEMLAETPEGFDEIELPFPVRPGSRGLLAKGHSEYPLVEEGDVLIVHDRVPPQEAIGKRAVVKIYNGPVLYKKVRRGSRPHYFNLESINQPMREDVDLEWAEIVEAIIPAVGYRR